MKKSWRGNSVIVPSRHATPPGGSRKNSTSAAELRVLSAVKFQTSSRQDGGVGRNPLLPRTKRRITTNLKSINNKKCQKVKLYGTLITNELKQSTRTIRLVRQWTEITWGKAADRAGGAD